MPVGTTSSEESLAQPTGPNLKVAVSDYNLNDLLKLLPPTPERPEGVLLNAEDRAAMLKDV